MYFLILPLLAFLVWKLMFIGRRPRDLPPGPPTLPVLGNLHLIPRRDVHLQFQRWAKEFGPVYSLMLGSKVMIVLSSDRAVKDLLDKRSAIYSDRMDLYVSQTLASGGLRLLLMRYGQSWRMVRRILHGLLNTQAAQSFRPYQLLESQQMMFDILNEPENFKQHFRRYSNSLTTTTTFGYRVPTYEDPHFKELFQVSGEFVLIAQTGTAALLDYMPALRYFPSWILPPKRRAKAHHQREKALYRYHWDFAKGNILSSPNPNPCFSIGLIEEQKKWGFDDDFASYVTGTLLEAGSETTANTLLGFLCAMLVFPEVQHRARAEVDRAVGLRIPSFDDEPQMQYVRGCVKESLRWMPTTILGAIPHAVTRDDYYMGFRIPAGAGVLNNVYAIHNDPLRYPHPDRFDPDRFKDDRQSSFDAAMNPDVSERDHFTFGAGRRICQGMHVAEKNLFLGIARLLWGFEFRPPVREDGSEIIPDPTQVTQGFVCSPSPFKAIISPRDSTRAEIIRKEWRDAREKNLETGSMQWKKVSADTQT
ncbi:putative cytochrome P450 [Xylaria grammica]|nr:putative cytochrome P450 [Xylaria grammica]